MPEKGNIKVKDLKRGHAWSLQEQQGLSQLQGSDDGAVIEGEVGKTTGVRLCRVMLDMVMTLDFKCVDKLLMNLKEGDMICLHFNKRSDLDQF